MFDWLSGLFGKLKNRTLPERMIERAFDAVPAISTTMEQNINLWYSEYIGDAPWLNCDVRPLGLPAAIVRELSRPTLTELEMTVTGGARADFLNAQVSAFRPHLKRNLEMGLALGGIAFKPYLERGAVRVDATTALSFTPIAFDGAGRATAGVFRDLTKVGKKWFSRLEFHRFYADTGTYTVQNKAYESDEQGSIRAPVSLQAVEPWAGIAPEVTIENVKQPLFSYFKPPSANDVEPGSNVGVSVYGGATSELIKQADEQWERLWWEYKSGERRIFTDGALIGAPDAANGRLFQSGLFTTGGEFFHEFCPEFRDDPLYRGFQRILKLIEFNVGLSYGTISDPQVVEKTAEEIKSGKQRMYTTVADLQTALDETLHDIVYAMDVYTTLYGLAPAGTYEVLTEFGDSILNDEDSRREQLNDMRMDVSAGLIRGELYVAQKYNVSEEDALLMMPKLESVVE